MSFDAIPSQHPGASSSMGAALREVLEKYMMRVDGMLPATVVSYNRTTNRATVIPSVARVATGGQRIPRAPLASIPVLSLGGGGFNVTFPLQPGATGWIEASDRDVSLWLQGQGKREAVPNTGRIHSFSDGRFIPDVLGDYTLPGDTDGAMVIQHKDGSTYIALHPDKIELFAPGGVWTNGIRIDTHTHGGVRSGGENTGEPNQ